MVDNYSKLFANIKITEPSADLFVKIMDQINSQKRSNSRRWFALFTFVLIGSLVSLVPIMKLLLSDFSQSGFVQFFSLIFTDTNLVLVYWQSFSLSLIESLPIVDVVIFLFVAWVFLGSLRFLIKYAQNSFTHLSLTN